MRWWLLLVAYVPVVTSWTLQRATFGAGAARLSCAMPGDDLCGARAQDAVGWVERARADTRGVQRWIHLNNAGASLMPAPVVDAYVGYLREEEQNGGYEVAAARGADLESFYGAAAAVLNCHEGEVAFVESASRGWALAFYSLTFREGDRIITSAADYGSNFVSYLQVSSSLPAPPLFCGRVSTSCSGRHATSLALRLWLWATTREGTWTWPRCGARQPTSERVSFVCRTSPQVPDPPTHATMEAMHRARH